MTTLELNPHHTDVVVRVYANMKKLEVALSENGRMTSLEGLSPFVHGFNQDKSLFDFVDVGGSQECIEKKTWGKHHP